MSERCLECVWIITGYTVRTSHSGLSSRCQLLDVLMTVSLDSKAWGESATELLDDKAVKAQRPSDSSTVTQKRRWLLTGTNDVAILLGNGRALTVTRCGPNARTGGT